MVDGTRGISVKDAERVGQAIGIIKFADFEDAVREFSDDTKYKVKEYCDGRGNTDGYLLQFLDIPIVLSTVNRAVIFRGEIPVVIDDDTVYSAYCILEEVYDRQCGD